jgi:hypothetical protein
MFWEATLAIFSGMSVFLFMQGIGFGLTASFILGSVGLLLAIFVLEAWLPAYRFRRAAAELRAHPEEGDEPKARTPGEVLGEIISEGPTFDRTIGRGSKGKK